MQTLSLKQISQSPLGYIELSSSRNSRDQMKVAIKSYFEVLTGTRPTNENLDQIAKEYVASTDQERVKDHVEAFFVSMRGRPPKTIQQRLSLVRTFLRRNKLDPAKKDEYVWKDLQRKIKGNHAVTVDSVASNEEMRKVILEMSILGQAMTLTAKSSGARMGELLGMKLQDLDLDSEPIRLTIRSSGQETEDTKEGGSRIIFGDREAKEALQRWIKARPGWLEQAAAKTAKRVKSHGVWIVVPPKDKNDPHLFPITQESMHTIYNNALARAGYLKKDPRTGIATLHFHTLRKFFRTRLGPVLPQDILEAFMGHGSAVVQVYRKYTIDQLAEFYRKAEPALWVLSDMAPVHDRMEELEKKNQELHAELEGVKELFQAAINLLRYNDESTLPENLRKILKRKEGEGQ